MTQRGLAAWSAVAVVVAGVLSSCEPGAKARAPEPVGSARQGLSVGMATSAGTTSFVGGGNAAPAVFVDPDLVVSGTDTITGAVVSLGSGFLSAQDRLTYAQVGSIVGSYDQARGTLTLSGSGTAAAYQAALRAVRFSSASSTPAPGTRVVTFSLGSALSNPANGHFYEFVSYGGTWTQARTNAATRTYLGMQGYLATLTSLSENDFVRLKLTSDGWIGAQANPENSYPRTWSWVTGPESGTAFCSDNGYCSAISGRFNNWAGGEPNNSGGEGCGQIYFTNSGLWNDLPCNTVSLPGYVVEYGGMAGDTAATISGTKSVVVSFAATSIAANAGTLTSDQGAAATLVSPTITVSGTATVTGATVSLTTGFAGVQDVLSFTPGGGITGSFNTSTGVLTLGGTADMAAYQAVFRTVTYQNTVAPLPVTNPRVVTFSINGVSAARALQVRSLPTVVLTTTASPRSYLYPLTLTATLTPSTSTGTVQFFDGSTLLGSGTLSGGVATFSTSTLSLGAHTLSANYGGDTQRLPSSGTAEQTISPMSPGEGPCTALNQATVCGSGSCNTTTGTCGVANGGSCTAANQCVSNICGANGQCGVVNGGACTAGTAALCQGGACSPNTNTCIPAGGCAVTADCGAGQQCNVGTLQCETAPGIDTSAGVTVYEATEADVFVDPDITVVGANAITGASVTLGTGFVSAQDSLVYSTVNGITGSYNASTGILSLAGTTTAANYQAALRSVKYHNAAGALPSTALRTITFAVGSAVANGTNGHFYEFVSYSGTWTQARAHAETRTYLGLRGYLATLISGAENDFVRQKLTSDGWIGARANPESTYPRTWSWVTGPEAGTPFCANPSSGVCTAISGGYSNWASGEPNNAGGEGCGQIYFQNSGRWNDLACNSGSLPGYLVEYGGSAGDPVLSLTDTKALQVRAKTSVVVSSSQARPQLHAAVTFTATFSPAASTGQVQFSIDGAAFGSPVSIGGGAATLTVSTLALGSHAVTVSYAGDTQRQAATGTLATPVIIDPLVNGAGPCDNTNAATDCQSGVCSAQGTCGYGTNEGPCTAGPSSVCQSGVCSLGGACMPATLGACYVDADCGASTYCDRASNRCVTLLTSGTSIPNDGLHDGTCQGSESRTCASGACNETTDTCSTALGTSCTSAAQCTSNACAASGACIPSAPGSCWADAECASGAYCNRGAYSCTATLAAGTSIPTDGLHDGTCQGSVSATCASGACNTTTDTCSTALGTSCTSAAQCTSNACAASGACIPSEPGSCWADSDCGATDYCDRATYSCTAKRVAGVAIPSDGLHDGTCVGNVSPTCASGACNETTDTCSTALGTSCTSAAQCTSNACAASGACIPSAPGSCWADSDCGASQYCDRGAYTCTTKRVAGAPIPSDGLHDGVCASTTVAPACATGLCNATTNTCASAVGQSCAVAAECQFGTCSQGTCGFSNGESGCTATTAYLCQSGVCSASGACIPPGPGGCFADSDCTAAQFCNRATYVCASKLVAGGALPNDGLHDGVCTSALATATCQSATCNAVTNTCADTNGQGCTTAGQCVTNVCGGDGQCGHPAGEGPCTAATASTACRSGFCNATASGGTSSCVPSAASCWVDGDCAAGDYCARSTFTCTTKAVPGAPLPHDGLHAACVGGVSAACASGLCNAVTQTCAEANLATCTGDNQCVSNACGSNGRCGLADGQATCTAQDGATLCQSAACTPSGVCAPAGGCWVDSDCGAAQYCDRASLACHATLLAGVAVPSDGLHTGACNTLGAATCATGECNPTMHTCAAPKSATCATDAQCVSNECGSNGLCDLADGQAGCTVADASPCQSEHCSSAGVCVPAQSGSCWVDADCASAQHCKRDGLRCVPDGQLGDALANDGLHLGICSSALAQAACVSGACNPATNTCAGPTGTACTTASQCVVDVCGRNGRCGFADGQEGCTATTANRCQSQTCSLSGTCMPATGCWVDVDCAQGQYCDRATTTCKGQLSAGAALPSDGLHDGQCSEASAAALCVSRTCNAATNTCGVENSEGCTDDSQCESNVCGLDGKCGAPDGAACQSDSVCRNGCVDGFCANSDPGVLTGGSGCSAVAPDASVLWGLAALLLLLARRSRRAVAVGASAAVLVVAAPAQAQTEVSGGASVDTFRAAAPGSEWFSAESLDFRGTVRPAARLQLNWAHQLLVVHNADGTVRSTPIENKLSFKVGAGLTLFERVRVFAQVPLVAVQTGSMSAYGGQPLVATGGGLGDLGFGADVRLFGAYGGPFSLAAGATMTAPTGSREKLLGDGSASVMPRVLAAGEVGCFAWAAQAGFNFRAGSIGSVPFGNEVRLSASAGFKLVDGRLLVGPEFFAVVPVTSAGTPRAAALEGDLGVHYALSSQWRVGAGVGTGLIRSPGIPAVRALASVDWAMDVEAPSPLDTDRDGVADAQDQCPGEHGVASRSGCPAPADDDGDGVANADDLCPAQSTAGAADPKRRGCALPPDADGDGIPDADDQCREVAPSGPMNPKRPGCADDDVDGDGVLASRDVCPAQAPGWRVDPARAGCPVPDADGDFTPDAQDRCPNEKGGPSMDPEKNGCPGLVRVEEDWLFTNSPVFFAPGTATILPRSTPVLEAVKSALQAIPEAELVAVEGHTDAQGKVGANQVLSEQRAEAVRAWLVEHGISASRLEARGHGMTRLLVPDERTEADRQTNRRVEFHLVKLR